MRLSLDDDMEKTLDAWLRKQKYDRIIDLWVKGLDVDWNRLYKGNPPLKTSLPTYPFARERHWIPDPPDRDADPLPSLVSKGGEHRHLLHPLVHENTSTLGRTGFTSLFFGTEFFFSHHRVNREKILSAAACLEMAGAATGMASDQRKAPGASVRLSSITWTTPLRAAPDPLTVRIDLFPLEGGDPGNTRSRFEIASDRPGKEALVHCTGKAMVHHQGLAKEETMGDLPSLTELKERIQDKGPLPERFYQAFESMGIQYGPLHQCVTSLHCGEGEVLARLCLPPDAEKDSPFLFHPGILDGAFQACLALVWKPGPKGTWDLPGPFRPLLPFELAAMDMFGPCPSKAWAHARLKNPPGPGASGTLPDRFQADIDIFDDQGLCRARIRGLGAVRQKQGPKPRHRDRTMPEPEVEPENFFLVPQWDRAFFSGMSEPVQTPDECVVIIGCRSQDRAEVEKIFPGAFFLDPRKQGNTQETVTAFFRDIPEPDQVLFLAPDRALASPGDEAHLMEQENGVLLVFRTIKALLAKGHGERSLGLTLATFGACDVGGGPGPFNPVHAGIHGLAGSLAKEFPQWQVRAVDLEPGRGLPLDRVLGLPFDPGGQVVAFRKGEWFTNTLVPARNLWQGKTRFQKGGVYVLLGGAGGIGRVLTRHLMERYRARVFWIGRRKKDDRIQEYLAEFSGPAWDTDPPVYIQADARDREDLERARQKIRQSCPKIHGIVHSILVLADKGLESMDEETFRKGFLAKAETSLRMAQVFEAEDLDLVVFFSSLVSFATPPGQSNYAAGCAFTDAFSRCLAEKWPCAVRTVNWGYWGGLGAVSDGATNRRMARMGIGSIEPEEGLGAIDTLVRGSASQLGFLKTQGPQNLVAVNEALLTTQVPGGEWTDRTWEDLDTVLPALLEKAQKVDTGPMEELTLKLLAALLKGAGIFRENGRVPTAGHLDVMNPEPGNSKPGDPESLNPESRDPEFQNLKQSFPGLIEPWLAQCLREFARQGLVERPEGHWRLKSPWPDADTLWKRWEEEEGKWAEDSDLKARAALTRACLAALPDILKGKTPITDVMFKDASMALVEGIYRDSAITGLFNAALRDFLKAVVQGRRAEADGEPARALRIFEIGAGTGGTSGLLFPMLNTLGQEIGEYCYTDVSKAFLLHGQEAFKSLAPYLVCKRFDVTQPLEEQGFEPGSYDVVIAANVLHATPDMRETLGNAKALLRKNGVLLIHELSETSVFATATFGLLPAWWDTLDPELRIQGSPALSPETWERLLRTLGFEKISFPARRAHGLGFQVIAAFSNGWVRQRVSGKIKDSGKTRDSDKTKDSGKTQDRGRLIPEPPSHAGPQASASPGVMAAAPSRKVPKLRISQRRMADFVVQTLKTRLSQSLKVREAQIDTDEPFADYGVDSITGVNLVRTINKALSIDLATISLFDYNSIDRLSDHILSQFPGQVREAMALSGIGPDPGGLELEETLTEEAATGEPLTPKKSEQTGGKVEEKAGGQTHGQTHRQTGRQTVPAQAPLPATQVAEIPRSPVPTPSHPFGRKARERIAVVGMSGRFPGSENLEMFWENLCRGKNLVSEIRRFPPSLVENLSCRHGGFLDRIDAFDPLFFKISPQEADFMDPQQRIFLEEAYKALEDAGYAGRACTRMACGVYAGCAASGYRSLFNTHPPAQAFWGNAGSVIPARAAYHLDLHGPAVAVDTACSSSLTALHAACQGLWEHEIDMALAGGVFVQPTPEFYISADRAGMLSPTGQCHTFDRAADGFVPSEGAGVIVLRRLTDALRDGDHIHGVILGIGTNQDGSTNGLTAPSAASQERLERQVYEGFDISPESIGMVEAHGTGTILGDPIETTALTRAFRHFTDKAHFCALGSVKASMGHAITAAGMAGLFRALLSLSHGRIPPMAGFDQCNPEIRLEESPFYINTGLAKWPEKAGRPRRAAVSSFGFSGTNAHLVVEEAPQRAANRYSQPCYLVVLSARTPSQLRHQAFNLCRFIRGRDIDLGDMAYTLLTGRRHLNHRLATVAATVEALVAGLENWLKDDASSGPALPGETSSGIASPGKTSPGKISSGIASSDLASPDIVSPEKESPGLAVPDVVVADLDAQEVMDQEAQEDLEILGNQCIRNLASGMDPKEHQKQLTTLARLYTRGVALDFKALFGRGCHRIPLPTYPFERARHWIPETGPSRQVEEGIEPVRTASHPISFFTETWQALETDPPWGDSPLWDPSFWDPSLRGPAKDLAAGPLVCFLSNEELQDRFSRAMQKVFPQCRVVFVSARDPQGLADPAGFSAIPDDPQSLAKVLRGIAREQGTVTGMAWLWGYDRPDFVRDPTAIACLFKALDQERIRRPLRVLLGAPFSNDTEQCCLESWIGFSRSLNPSNGQPVTRVFLEEAKKLPDFHPLCHAFGAGDFTDTLFQDGKFHHLTVQPVSPVPGPFSGLSGSPPKTVLITGGLGKIGGLLCRHLARTHGCNLILAGRSVLDRQGQQALEALESIGSKVLYIKADCADDKALEKGIQKARRALGPITGLFHLAGRAGGTSLGSRDLRDFKAVLAPKIAGTLALDRVLEDEPLEFVCYFSSIAAVAGDFGSCDYSVGNRFQNAWARLRNHAVSKGMKKGTTLAIGWPMWKAGGMGFGTEAADRFYLEASGQSALSTDEGLRILETLLSWGRDQVLVWTGAPEKIPSLYRPDRQGGLPPSEGCQDPCRPAAFPHRQGDLSPLEEDLSPLAEDLSPLAEDPAFAARQGTDLEKMVTAAEEALKSFIASLLKIPERELTFNRNLSDFGFDSISLADLARTISQTFGISFTPSLFYGYSTIGKVAAYLVEREKKALSRWYHGRTTAGQARISSGPATPRTELAAHTGEEEHTGPDRTGPAQTREEQIREDHTREHRGRTATPKALHPPDAPIAVIGMAGRFPNAHSVDAFWENLVHSRTVVTTMPEGRGQGASISRAPGGRTGRKGWGGFMPDIDKFDPLFFEISPRDALYMDPCQRLFLEEAWRALEDAGYCRDRIKGSRCGVFAGVEEGAYAALCPGGDLGSNRNATLAGRIAYFLDLKGPNMALTASCSSGLLAVHQACVALRNGECDTALAGGASLLISPSGFAELERAGMLSPDGVCRVFDGKANGMVPAEAVAVVMLKPLSQALVDGDRIYGSIRASGVNYDGRSNGMTAPNLLRQADLIQEVYRGHGIDPRDLGLVMAHSVGSPLGDPVEIAALEKAFAFFTPEKHFCALGSVKPLIGHTFAASGVVSLITLLLSMEKGIIPRLYGFTRPGPGIDFSDSAFVIPKENRPWKPKKDTPLTGALTTTGVSGTNVHAVVQGPPGPMPESTGPDPAVPRLFVFSARNEEGLERLAASMAAFLEKTPGLAPERVAFTLLQRQPMAQRMAVMAPTLVACVRGLEAFGAGNPLPNLFCRTGQEMGEETGQETRPKTGEETGLHHSESVEPDPGIQQEETFLEDRAKAWVAGALLEWEDLHPEEKRPFLVRLPGYPFARKRYWAAARPQDKTSEPPAETQEENSPLQDDPVRESRVLALKEKIQALFCEFFHMDEAMDENRPFFELGVTSMNVAGFVENLEKAFAISLEVNELFNHPTLLRLAEFLETLVDRESDSPSSGKEEEADPPCFGKEEAEDPRLRPLEKSLEPGTPDPAGRGQEEVRGSEKEARERESRDKATSFPDLTAILEDLEADRIDVDQALARINASQDRNPGTLPRESRRGEVNG